MVDRDSAQPSMPVRGIRPLAKLLAVGITLPAYNAEIVVSRL